MTLAEDVRNELAAIAPARRCDALAEISALFHTAGSLHLRGHGELAFHLDVSASSVARRAFSLLRDLGVESEIRTYRQRAFDRSTRYQLHVLGGPRHGGRSPRGRHRRARWPPAELDRLRGSSGVPAAVPRTRGARCWAPGRSAARGRPSSRCASRSPTEPSSSFASRRRRTSSSARESGASYAVAFAHGAETVADMLALAGASDAALAIDEHAVVGAARAAANRLANADHANLVRTSRAAQEQLRAVHDLEERGALASLPDELQEIAALRVRHPGTVVSRARGEVRAARDEGGRPAQAGAAGRAGRGIDSGHG